MLFKRKAWKVFERDALALEESDPQKALELLDAALGEAPAAGASSPRVRILEDRIRIQQRLGRADAVQADRREIAAALEPELARIEAAIPSRQGQALIDALAERESLLTHIGRPAPKVEDARRSYLEGLDAVIGKTKSHLILPGLLDRRADLLERMERTVEGARTRLASAKVLRAFAGDKAAKAALATDAIFVARWGVVGFEMGEAFRGSYAKNLELRALQIEMQLVEQGRAAVIARCGKCRSVVQIDHVPAPAGGRTYYEAKMVRCPAGHTLKEFTVVVSEDAEGARAQLAS